MLRRLLSRLLCWLLGHRRETHRIGWMRCQRCSQVFRRAVTFPLVRGSEDLEVLVISCPSCGACWTHPTRCNGPGPEVAGE